MTHVSIGIELFEKYFQNSSQFRNSRDLLIIFFIMKVFMMCLKINLLPE